MLKDRVRNTLLQLQRIREIPTPLQCPRATVAAIITDEEVRVGYGIGRNFLEATHAPCTCNTHDIDTNAGGSSTCKAIHAEVNAINISYLVGWDETVNSVLITTRPPCKNCLEELLRTNIQAIITTDEYEDRDSSKEAWQSNGRKWVVLPYEKQV